MASWETFKLSELRLDQQNYRTGPQPSQRAAIRAIIDDQKNHLVNLARDLLDVGPSPGEPIWVTRDPDGSGMYIVLEGNRRTAALKIMETPALADGTEAENEFALLSKLYLAKPIRELEGRVFANRDEALPWIRRRHLSSESGVGLQRWKPMAKGRADREHGLDSPRSLAVVEFLDDGSDEWAEIAEALDSKWTTVDRVLNTRALRDDLGVHIDTRTGTVKFENGDIPAGAKLLRRILSELAISGFDFSRVERVGDRKKFLGGFLSGAVKATQSAAGGSAKSTGSKGASSGDGAAGTATGASTGTSSRARTGGTKAKDSQRSTLAPRTGQRTFQVNGTRLNPLYRECRDIAVSRNENAAAFLLRVFIELSSEALLTEKSVPLPPVAVKAGKKNWADFGITLSMKVESVINFLDPTGKDKKFQQARVARDSASHATFSIGTLHSYFHNLSMQPVGTALQEAWDAWESYMQALHEAR